MTARHTFVPSLTHGGSPGGELFSALTATRDEFAARRAVESESEPETVQPEAEPDPLAALDEALATLAEDVPHRD